MALPAGFPPDVPSNYSILRFYKAATAASASYDDNAFFFLNTEGKQAYSNFIYISATGADLTFSFDGVTAHGIVKSGDSLSMENRIEGGIAVKGSGATFTIMAW